MNVSRTGFESVLTGNAVKIEMTHEEAELIYNDLKLFGLMNGISSVSYDLVIQLNQLLRDAKDI